MPTIKTRSRQKNAFAGGSMEGSAELGVLFGCLSGVCGKCATTVLSGLNNLSAPNELEKAMDLEPSRRLMCQTKINKGTVKLDLD
ncbi:MAG: 2Fe-2S iron-sulfur cluster-binding protein [Candidatus Krumholzibacteria bacterium]|nr:2Fe-2S iron-sulfur cluster-binding protein [Candidatus Krumholzibacteria bacterium]